MINYPRILDVKLTQIPIPCRPSDYVPIVFIIGYTFYAQIEVEYDEDSKRVVIIERQLMVHANAKSIRRGRRKMRSMIRRLECYLHRQHKLATDPDFVRKICGFPQ